MLAQDIIQEENMFVLDCIGIRRTDADAGDPIPTELNSLTIVQLKALCNARVLPVSGNKHGII